MFSFCYLAYVCVCVCECVCVFVNDCCEKCFEGAVTVDSCSLLVDCQKHYFLVCVSLCALEMSTIFLNSNCSTRVFSMLMRDFSFLDLAFTFP